MITFIVDGIVFLFFIFYWHRLVSTVLSYLIRAYTWRTFGIYIDIEALQFSPLAGRLFFKGIRYHGENQTVFIHGGYITWRYWTRKVKQCEIFNEKRRVEENDTSKDVEGHASAKESKKLPCRVVIKVQGVEAFLYNRSPVYDAILTGLEDHAQSTKTQGQETTTYNGDKSGATEHITAQSDSIGSSSSSGHGVPQHQGENIEMSGLGSKPIQFGQGSESSQDTTGRKSMATAKEPPAFLRLLPIWVEVSKGAAILGNENTKSIISAKFGSATGEFDASKASSLDLFKILMSFDVVKPYIQMKPNVDYKISQLDEAIVMEKEAAAATSTGYDIDDTVKSSTFRNRRHRSASSMLSTLGRLTGRYGQSSESIAVHPNGRPGGVEGGSANIPLLNYERWQGLSRYLEDDKPDETNEWDAVEYAKSSVIADLEGLSVKFFWDIPGVVLQQKSRPTQEDAKAFSEDINGTAPPEYGLSMAVRGGHVNYGPWADRHRVILQQIFFPAPYCDAIPAAKLEPGMERVSTQFSLALTIERDTVLRIPFRESSKDSKWRGRAAGVAGKNEQKSSKTKRQRRGARHKKREQAGTGRNLRPYAWFDITVKSNSKITYNMDMIAGKLGFGNKLGVSVSAIEISSSLNHALLWRSSQVVLDCDLSFPLSWNGFREWLFKINVSDLELFLLRDHTFLLVDLINDWSTGPPPDFLTFVPFRYLLQVHFSNFKLFLNTNDANIIDNAEDMDQNEYVILHGEALDADMEIPLDRYIPADKDILFDVLGSHLGFELCMPSANTLSTLLVDKQVAKLDSVKVNGMYNVCTDIRPGMTDTLNMTIAGNNLTMHFFGFLARHLIKVKGNYFGDNVHFRTLQEYQELVQQGQPGPDAEQFSARGNDLDVILDIKATDATFLLPASLYDCSENVWIKVDNADIDLRVNSPYLEMMVNSSPLHFGHTSKALGHDGERFSIFGTELFLDGLKVFGHRLFGLSPKEPAYVSNFDIDAGSLMGECSLLFLQKLVAAVKSLVLTIDDEENAIPVPHAQVIHDSTYVRFDCPLIKLWCLAGDGAILLDIRDIGGSFNNLARGLFSKKLIMSIPEITLACTSRDVLHHNSSPTIATVNTFAHIQTTLFLQMVGRDYEFTKQKQLQQAHIQLHDQPSKRAQFLLASKHTPNAMAPGLGDSMQELSVPVPSLPGPLLQLENVNHASLEHHPLPFSHHDANWQDSGLQLVSDFGSGQAKISHHNESCATDGIPQVRDQEPYVLLRKPAITSPYTLPCFQLAGVQLDLRDIPRIPSKTASVESGVKSRPAPVGTISDKDAVHTSLLVDLKPGITAYCTPKALDVVRGLMGDMQAQDPRSMLDDLQFSVVSEVLAAASKKNGINSILDLKVQVPHIHVRIVNEFSEEEVTEQGNRSDKYNLIIQDLVVSARFKTVPGRRDDDDGAMMYSTVRSISLSAHEGAEQRHVDEAAMQVVIEDILVWMVDSTKTSVNVTLGDAEITMASTQVQYLAALIHRTTMLVDKLQMEFNDTFARQNRRLQYLIYKLVGYMMDHQSPTFLTKGSYIIRSSPTHIRNSESWKILSQLRYVLLQLDEQNAADLSHRCMSGGLDLPENNAINAIATLDHWRDWDTAQAAETIVIRYVYGTTLRVTGLHDKSGTPLSLSIRAGRFGLIADPGPEQNDLSIEQLNIGVSIVPPPPPPSGLNWFEGHTDTKRTTVQIDNLGIALQLNWHICPLVDKIIYLFEESAPAHKHVDQELSPFLPGSIRTFTEETHIVFVSDFLNVKLTTPNLVNLIELEGIKTSATGIGWHANATELSANVLLSAKAASIGMHGHGRSLWRSEVNNPSIWMAYDKNSTPENISQQSLKLVGDSTRMSFEIQEELVGLTEMVHAVVGDEVVYVKRLIDTHAAIDPPPMSEPAVTEPTTPLKMHVALFLHDYNIGITLLQDLRYSISGQVARASIIPDAKFSSTYVIDFDLKPQKHHLSNNDNEKQQTVFELVGPPINGSVRLLHTDNITTASATLCVEKLMLEGQSIYALLSTLTSTRVKTAIEAVTEDVAIIQTRISQVFPLVVEMKPVPAGDDNVAKPFIFDANMTFGGLAISTSAPSATEHTSVRTLCEVHSFHIRAANRSAKADIPLPSPEIRLVLEQITLDLQSVHHKHIKDCGKLTMGVLFTCTIDQESSRATQRAFTLSVFGPNVELFAETAPAAAEIYAYLQHRLKHLDLIGNRKYFRRLRHPDPQNHVKVQPPERMETDDSKLLDSDKAGELTSTFAFDLQAISFSYNVRDSVPKSQSHDKENLVLSLKSMNLLAKSKAEAKLNVEDLQVALVSPASSKSHRAQNSALLPEIVFNVKYYQTKTDRKFTFHAAGKALDTQLEPLFMLPVNDIQRSITISSKRVRAIIASLDAVTSTTEPATKPQKLFGQRELTFLLVSADFAGAVVHMHGQNKEDFSRPAIAALNLDRTAQQGRYGQFVNHHAESTVVLRAPGISLRLQYEDPRVGEADLNVELRIDASSNTLHPSVVPLILQITQTVKQLVHDSEDVKVEVVEPVPKSDSEKAKGEAGTDENIVTADPRAILGRTRLNVGLRICRQEFVLSCQPIAKVAASAKLEDIYITINTVESQEHGNFFAISASITGLSVSLSHVYSRDPTLSFDMESIILSVMNSKHVKGTSGISAILKINPSRAQVNARQIGDALLFREIWLPPEIREAAMPVPSDTADEPQEYFVTRYKEIAASTSFPWHATVAIAELAADLDFGQAIGKTSMSIKDMWASSNKTTNSQQNLCVGIASASITSTGRMSGVVDLEEVKVRTSIAWPESDTNHEGGPLVQGSLGFKTLKLKAAFDYQAFAAVDIANFEFVMYNVHTKEKVHGDRLVAILDGDKVNAFITSSAAAAGLSLFQAFERLLQERRTNYEQSLREIGRFLRRRSSVYNKERDNTRERIRAILLKTEEQKTGDESVKHDLTLHTDVVVTLRSLVVGAFPTTLMDHQILKAEASDIQARFAATLEDDLRIHSGLGLTLGQLSVGLSQVPRSSIPSLLSDITVESVVSNALAARGGIILRVPKVLAMMQTWQSSDSDTIDYLFRSTFEGKIDIGWNYSRISFIRGMWATHIRTLASRLGKPLPESAVTIRGVPEPSHDEGTASEEGARAGAKQEKITAEVKLPQSRYQYRALEPPVIETPQLRDMGEATPPLEWVGLHRDKLPGLTHQIVIVALLGVAREVEDAYTRILGNA